MKISDAAAWLSRKAWLSEAEQDLAGRLERRIAALEDAWHANDPLYQRLWLALTRVRLELSRVEQALAANTGSGPAN